MPKKKSIFVRNTDEFLSELGNIKGLEQKKEYISGVINGKPYPSVEREAFLQMAFVLEEQGYLQQAAAIYSSKILRMSDKAEELDKKATQGERIGSLAGRLSLFIGIFAIFLGMLLISSITGDVIGGSNLGDFGLGGIVLIILGIVSLLFFFKRKR